MNKEEIKKEMNNKAQFYLVAAVIIIAVIVGIAVYSNYATPRNENTKVYDLGKELGKETGEIYDYGTLNGAKIDSLMKNWAGVYSDYTKSQQNVEDWFFIFGDDKNMSIVTFTVIDAGEVGIYTGGKKSKVPIKVGAVNVTSIGSIYGGKVNVTFRNLTYNFELNEGENFFFVIKTGEYSSIGG